MSTKRQGVLKDTDCCTEPCIVIDGFVSSMYHDAENHLRLFTYMQKNNDGTLLTTGSSDFERWTKDSIEWLPLRRLQTVIGSRQISTHHIAQLNTRADDV